MKNNFVNPQNVFRKQNEMHHYIIPSSPVVGRTLYENCEHKPSGKMHLRSRWQGIAKNFNLRVNARLYYQTVKLQHAGYYLICLNPQNSRIGSAAERVNKLINHVGKLNANIIYIHQVMVNYMERIMAYRASREGHMSDIVFRI
jgi:hypothetical protein